MPVADAGDAVFVPTIGPRPRVIVREVIPGLAVAGIVLAHRAPGAFAQIWPPSFPVFFGRARLLPSFLFFCLSAGFRQTSCGGCDPGPWWRSIMLHHRTRSDKACHRNQ